MKLVARNIFWRGSRRWRYNHEHPLRRNATLTHQIILLPKSDYWSWVRACRTYVSAFGSRLTADAEGAARYMAPQQTITFPRSAPGYAIAGDIERWFKKNHPQIRLDPIPGATPNAFQEQLGRRVDADDRFGLKAQSFFLVWPTDFPVITQPFAANPQLFDRLGIPGHEGVDVRTQPQGNVYACAEGVVYRVCQQSNGHPYGIHVRLRHREGYRTVYGFLGEVTVREGEQVQAGQMIGRAPSLSRTGGGHIHLGLKHDGASDRGLTTFPKDILDPTPFLIHPDDVVIAAETRYGWSAGRCLIGVNGRVGGTLEDADFTILQKVGVEALRIEAKEPLESLARARQQNPALFVMVNLQAQFDQDQVAPQTFVDSVALDVGRFYRAGVRFFELHANPNLRSHGWGIGWQNGREFGAWFSAAQKGLRKIFPEARLGIPGCSPGPYIEGWRADATQFSLEMDAAVWDSDWIGTNLFWEDWQSLEKVIHGGGWHALRQRYPEKLIFVTECGNAVAGMPMEEKGRQLVRFYRALREQSGIGAAFAYAISAQKGHHALGWRDESGVEREIVSILAQEEF